MSTSTLEDLRRDKRESILALANKHGVRDVRVFGSVARGEDGPDSDIDFLINLEKGRNILDWIEFKIEMEDLMAPKKIDVWPERNLKKFFLADVLDQAKDL